MGCADSGRSRTAAAYRSSQHRCRHHRGRLRRPLDRLASARSRCRCRHCRGDGAGVGRLRTQQRPGDSDIVTSDPDDIIARHGAAGERFVGMLRDSAATLFDVARRYDIAAEQEQSGWIQPVHSPGRIKIAERRVKQWSKFGAPVELLSREQVRDMLKKADAARAHDTNGRLAPENKTLAAFDKLPEEVRNKKPDDHKTRNFRNRSQRAARHGGGAAACDCKKVRKLIAIAPLLCRRAGRIADGERSRSSADGSDGSAPRSGQLRGK